MYIWCVAGADNLPVRRADVGRRYSRLDAYNLYTCDYVTCSARAALYDSASSVVREGYIGSQFYWRDVYDDALVQKHT